MTTTACQVKLELLVHGVRLDFPSLQELADYKTDKYLHNDRHFTLREERGRVPQELRIRDDSGIEILTGVLSRPDSPYELRVADGEMFLWRAGRQLEVQVSALTEPLAWRETTSDGVPMYKLVSLLGTAEINLWPWHDCALHYEKTGCAFCTTTGTAARAGHGPHSELLTAHAVQRAAEDVRERQYQVLATRSTESVAAVLRTDAPSEYWLTIISGNLTQHLLDYQHALFGRLVADLIERVPRLRGQRIVANLMPPNDPQSIAALGECGINYYMGNLEVWGEAALNEICPGKALYGREKLLAMLDVAVDTFGAGHCWSNFVCGIEDLREQADGARHLIRRGIVPGANIFHRDPKVNLDWHPSANLQSIRDYYMRVAEALHQGNLMPFYSVMSRRSSLLWEAYFGWL